MEDVYFHREITFRLGGVVLRLATSQELFSSYDVDTGTRFLLHTIAGGGYRPRRILDLGCGYGAIGLALKRLHPESAVHMVDRDALAVAYSRKNAGLNGIEGVAIYGSLGYDDVTEGDFDLIAMNVPGKAGMAVTRHLLEEAGCYLAPGGVVAIVVVKALEDAVSGILGSIRDVTVTLKRHRPSHTVFHYRFGLPRPRPAESAFGRGIYHRGTVRLESGGFEAELVTAQGLPEFDSLGYGTRLVIRNLEKLKAEAVRRAVVFSPGQGHTAVAVWKVLRPERIELVGRDLLALRYAHLNLTRNGCPAEEIETRHQVGAGGGQDAGLFIGTLEEGSAAALAALCEAEARLLPGGTAVLAAPSTVITRAISAVRTEGKLRIISRERLHGASSLVLEKML
ncbi:MAG: class I SAM-dependent methyltransferase [Dehalococcoidales bacterium]|nr:class I SAM-dependent methyltransferase [Dehalococcoidales bacterium]